MYSELIRSLLLGLQIFMPLESTLVLCLIVLVAIPLCGAILELIKRAGTKYYAHFFKNPGKLSVKILGAQINLQVAGIVFLFLAIVIVLTLLYAVLRMVPGRS